MLTPKTHLFIFLNPFNFFSFAMNIVEISVPEGDSSIKLFNIIGNLLFPFLAIVGLGGLNGLWEIQIKVSRNSRNRVRLVSNESFHWIRWIADMCPLLDTCPNPAVSSENFHWTQAFPLEIGIAFADVVGADQAILYLQEVVDFLKTPNKSLP